MKKISILLLLTLVMSISLFKGFAQSNDLEARAACLKGEEAFDNGNYSNAVTYLQEAKSKLGETKPRIQYTLVRALKAAGKYSEAKRELKTFFDVTQEDNSEVHFLEMVKSIADLNESERVEQEKVRAAQVQEQQRLIAIEGERREREAKRLEEQKLQAQREKERLEQVRLDREKEVQRLEKERKEQQLEMEREARKLKKKITRIRTNLFVGLGVIITGLIIYLSE